MNGRIGLLIQAAEDATKFSSSPEPLHAHPSFRAVIDTGEDAIPFLLERLQKEVGSGDLRWGAIRALLELIPDLLKDYPKEDAGRLDCLATFILWQSRHRSLGRF